MTRQERRELSYLRNLDRLARQAGFAGLAAYREHQRLQQQYDEKYAAEGERWCERTRIDPANLRWH
jgi:hypothetical protein